MRACLSICALLLLQWVDLVHGQDPICERGIPGRFGLLAACCAPSCGECGGQGCSRRPGGGANCCGGGIAPQNRDCAVVDAPCVVPRDPTCATGLANTREGICCAAECGVCGGAVGGGCDSRFNVPEGRSTDTRCCTQPILQANRPCSQFAPPCTLDSRGGGNGPDPTCATGILSPDGSCCSSSCGRCGGTGCSGLSGGASACCTNSILNADRSCSQFGPPCVVDRFPGPNPGADPTCTTGIFDSATNTCCDSQCGGECGGSGCSRRPGGRTKCCTGAILDSNRFCRDFAPPCIV